MTTRPDWFEYYGRLCMKGKRGLCERDALAYAGTWRGRCAQAAAETLAIIAEINGEAHRLTGRRPRADQTGLLRRPGGATSRADGPGTLNRSRGHNAVLRPIRRPDVHP